MKNAKDQATSANGIDLKYNDAGSGNAVFLLQASMKSHVADLLAEGFRVVTFEVRDPHDGRHLGQALSRTAEQLSIAKYCLVAESELASPAIAHVLDSGDSVEALVLIAPKADGSNGASIDLRLEQINAPTLVLVGTRDQVVTPETGREYARRIPKCFYTLVYDAGHDIGADRPHALYAVVRDFLERREKFVLAHESSVINP